MKPQRLIDADALKDWSEIVPLTWDGGIDINDFEEKLKSMPTIEMLTADEMLTIRIHMGAIKERLCNQKRWSEAVDYQIIIDKLDTMLKMEEEE